jgi:hypothetical protein
MGTVLILAAFVVLAAYYTLTAAAFGTGKVTNPR